VSHNVSIVFYLRFDGQRRSISSTSRAKTPPSSSLDPSRNSPSRARLALASPPRRNYHRFRSDSSKNWNTKDSNDGQDEDGAEFDNEDEDEFGLPSIASTRRKATTVRNDSATNTIFSGTIPKADAFTKPGTWRLDNGDIAEERGLPKYPIARQIEGKILRPQYKDILKGMFDRMRKFYIDAKTSV